MNTLRKREKKKESMKKDRVWNEREKKNQKDWKNNKGIQIIIQEGRKRIQAWKDVLLPLSWPFRK